MEHKLTKKSKRALANIYKTYLSRIKNGDQNSSYFDAYSDDTKALDPIVSDSLQELSNAGYIKTDIVGGYALTDAGIIFMENLPVDTIKEWLSFVAQIIP